MKLYHGTGYDKAKEIEYRGLVARKHLSIFDEETLRKGYPDITNAWLTTSKREANDHGDAIVEFEIPNHFITTSMSVNKPVYLDGNIAAVKGGIPAKYVKGIWFMGEFEPNPNWHS